MSTFSPPVGPHFQGGLQTLHIGQHRTVFCYCSGWGGGGGEHAPSDRPSGLAAPQDRPGLARPGPEWRTTTLHGPCRPLSWGWERQEGTPEQGHQKKETGKSWIRSSSKGPFSPPSRWGGSLGRRTCWNVEPRPRGNPGSGCRLSGSEHQGWWAHLPPPL